MQQADPSQPAVDPKVAIIMGSSELERYTDDKKIERRLVELNVIEGVHNLAKTSIIQESWAQRGAHSFMVESTTCPTACFATSP